MSKWLPVHHHVQHCRIGRGQLSKKSSLFNTPTSPYSHISASTVTEDLDMESGCGPVWGPFECIWVFPSDYILSNFGSGPESFSHMSEYIILFRSYQILTVLQSFLVGGLSDFANVTNQFFCTDWDRVQSTRWALTWLWGKLQAMRFYQHPPVAGDHFWRAHCTLDLVYVFTGRHSKSNRSSDICSSITSSNDHPVHTKFPPSPLPTAGLLVTFWICGVVSRVSVY